MSLLSAIVYRVGGIRNALLKNFLLLHGIAVLRSSYTFNIQNLRSIHKVPSTLLATVLESPLYSASTRVVDDRSTAGFGML